MDVVSEIGVWFDLDHMAHGPKKFKTSPNGRMHARKHLFQPSSVASEILVLVFSILSNSFKNRQDQSLRD